MIVEREEENEFDLHAMVNQSAIDSFQITW